MGFFQSTTPPQSDNRLDIIIGLLNALVEGFAQMSGTLSSDISDLQADVAGLTGAVQSSSALITGFAAALANAISQATSAGATPSELQALSDLHTAIVAQTAALSSAVAANPLPPSGGTTPTPTPAPVADPAAPPAAAP